MKNLIPILCIFFSFPLFGQLNQNLRYTMGTQFAAGLFDGANQSYLFHNHRFKRVFPNSVENEIAWKRKWAKDENGNVIVGKEKFLGSASFLAWTQDVHHFTRTAGRAMDMSTILVYSLGVDGKKKWYWYAADLGLMFAARTVGFHVAYSLIL